MISLRAACARALRPSVSLPRTSIQARSLHLARAPPSLSHAHVPRSPYAPRQSLRSVGGTRAFSLWPFSPSPAPAPLPPSPELPPNPPPIQEAAPTAAASPPPPPVDTVAASPPPPSPVTEAPPSLPDIPPEALESIPDIPAEALQTASWPVMHFGDLSALDLGMGWTPASWAREAFEIVAATTGLPLWGSIILLTVLLRFALLPLVIPSMVNGAKLANISPEMKEIQTRIKAQLTKGDQIAANFEQRSLGLLMRQHDVKLSRSFMYPVAQALTSIACFFGFRSMALKPVPQLLEGGTLWFKDLTVEAHIFGSNIVWWAPWTWIGVDAMWGLPMIATAAMWVNAKYGGDIGGPTTMQMQNMRSIASGMVILFCFVTLTQPQAVCLYFLTNNILLLIQSFVLSLRPVRNYFEIPDRIVKEEELATTPWKWREAPAKFKGWMDNRAKIGIDAATERYAQQMAREQRRASHQPIKWIDHAESQRLAQQHAKNEKKHASAPAEAHQQVHLLERERLAKDQAAIKANRAGIKQEGRQQRPKGKHMR